MTIDTINLARQIRKDVLMMCSSAHSSHVASCLSIADIVAVLYGEILNIDLKNVNSLQRDICILSKGHAGAAIYSALANKGFFDKNILKTYYKDGSLISGHISHKGVKGVEWTTGSLGHGFSVATGIAFVDSIKKNTNSRIFVLVGDGETEEGTFYEMVQFAGKKKLNNLKLIIDANKMQALGFCKDILDGYKIIDWNLAGWDIVNIDGHNHAELIKVLGKKTDKPLCIVANTIKGKGVSFMENELLWHYRDPQNEQLKQALREVDQN